MRKHFSLMVYCAAHLQDYIQINMIWWDTFHYAEFNFLPLWNLCNELSLSTLKYATHSVKICTLHTCENSQRMLLASHCSQHLKGISSPSPPLIHTLSFRYYFIKNVPKSSFYCKSHQQKMSCIFLHGEKSTPQITPTYNGWMHVMWYGLKLREKCLTKAPYTWN